MMGNCPSRTLFSCTGPSLTRQQSTPVMWAAYVTRRSRAYTQQHTLSVVVQRHRTHTHTHTHTHARNHNHKDSPSSPRPNTHTHYRLKQSSWYEVGGVVTYLSWVHLMRRRTPRYIHIHRQTHIRRRRYRCRTMYVSVRNDRRTKHNSERQEMDVHTDKHAHTHTHTCTHTGDQRHISRCLPHPTPTHPHTPTHLHCTAYIHVLVCQQRRMRTTTLLDHPWRD
jgi:hypothetical protein